MEGSSSAALLERLHKHFPGAQWEQPPSCLDDDSCMRWLYKSLSPRRHLEFGTWMGDGVLRVLEASPAAVWTINRMDGEIKKDGAYAYTHSVTSSFPMIELLPQFVQKYSLKQVQTDAGDEIGRKYLKANLGHRVHQIYCDSREWDDLAYPNGFFDSAYIDGGHQFECARSDMYRAIRLLKPGGLFLLHGFCPDPVTNAQHSSTVEVTAMIGLELEKLRPLLEDFFFIDGTWLLCGVRNHEAADPASEAEIFFEARERGLRSLEQERSQGSAALSPTATQSIPLYESPLDGPLEYCGYVPGKDFPTSPDDHFATPWFYAPPDKNQTLRITIEFSGRSGTWQCLAQNRNYDTIGAAVWPPQHDGPLEMGVIENTDEIRLVMVPSDLSSHGIPQKVCVATDSRTAEVHEKIRRTREAARNARDARQELSHLQALIQEKEARINALEMKIRRQSGEIQPLRIKKYLINKIKWGGPN